MKSIYSLLNQNKHCLDDPNNCSLTELLELYYTVQLMILDNNLVELRSITNQAKEQMTAVSIAAALKSIYIYLEEYHGNHSIHRS